MNNQLFLAVVLLFYVGCKQSVPQVADPERAHTALEHALNAWREGAEPTSLQSGSPAIYFNDQEWRSNRQLKSYKIEQAGRNGQGWSYEVLLTLGDTNRTKQRHVSYQVDTDPVIVIVQQP